MSRGYAYYSCWEHKGLFDCFFDAFQSSDIIPLKFNKKWAKKVDDRTKDQTATVDACRDASLSEDATHLQNKRFECLFHPQKGKGNAYTHLSHFPGHTFLFWCESLCFPGVCATPSGSAPMQPVLSTVPWEAAYVSDSLSCRKRWNSYFMDQHFNIRHWKAFGEKSHLLKVTIWLNVDKRAWEWIHLHPDLIHIHIWAIESKRLPFDLAFWANCSSICCSTSALRALLGNCSSKEPFQQYLLKTARENSNKTESTCQGTAKG